MSIEAYNIITQYCRHNEKDLAIRNHAYCIYTEYLQQALEKLDNNTPTRVEATASALLTEEAIKGYVSRAEVFSEEIIQSAISPIINGKGKHHFWLNVLSSIVGSFLFTGIIIAAYWMGKDYITSLFSG